LGKIWERTAVAEILDNSRRINGPHVFKRSHNPKVVGSNPTPATSLRIIRPELRIPAFSFVQVIRTGLVVFVVSLGKSAGLGARWSPRGSGLQAQPTVLIHKGLLAVSKFLLPFWERSRFTPRANGANVGLACFVFGS
jgi:hypothetical protein